jgi:hypothetical protein
MPEMFYNWYLKENSKQLDVQVVLGNNDFCQFDAMVNKNCQQANQQPPD